MSHYRPRFPVIIVGRLCCYKDKTVPLISDITEVQSRGVYFFEVPISESGEGGESSFEFVRTAVGLALERKIHALVTGPIAKEKWQRAGIPYNGHTEMLAKTAGIKNVAMFFWSEDLKVTLYTIHIPLRDIFSQIRRDKIVAFLRFVNKELTRLFKKRYSFLVCGLNPHAGEDGFMGTEEKEVIIPSIQELQPEMNIEGPYPPDTIFLKARDRKDSVVISWYHDQGLIAFKLLNIHSGVNVTLGLPYIRTSPDHGTAFDIAGKGTANPSSMTQAIRLAEHLVTLKN